MAKQNVNTTKTMAGDGPLNTTFQQDIARVRQLCKGSRVRSIKIYKNPNDKTNDGLYVALNGFSLLIPRGVVVPKVPEPMLFVLDEAGVEYSKESEWQNPDGTPWKLQVEKPAKDGDK